MKMIRHLLGPADSSRPLLWLQRRETWRGDAQANRIRLAALVVFAINELVNYYVRHVVDQRFHRGSMLLIALWLVMSGIFYLLLRHHFLPRSSPYLMSSVDLLLLTWLLFFADGPKSPLVVIYFLIIALSGTRLNPPVTLYTTAAGVLGYLSVLEFTRQQRPEFLVPVFHATIIVIALAFMGLIVAHLISRALALLSESVQKEVSSHG